MVIFVDYDISNNCTNDDSYGCMCVKCGRCGRQFDDNGMLKGEEDKIAEWEKMVRELEERTKKNEHNRSIQI